MTIDEAIKILELHNQWRRGADIPMGDPAKIGIAIDLVIMELKNFRAEKNILKKSCKKVL